MTRPFTLPEPVALSAQHGQTYPRFVELMQRLLAPDGCPWDREQTPESLQKYVLEEACEVIDAIASGSREALCEELGDLTLQVVFLTEIARREGAFGPEDVLRGIIGKLVRRHPHVFANAAAGSADEVLRSWEALKLSEQSAGGNPKGLLDGLPRSLPALARAQRTGEKVARVGFDWPDVRGSRDKLSEEFGELDHAIASGDAAAVEAELGDTLFALVNLARHLGVDAEAALRKTTDRFVRRFSHVEARVHEVHGGFPRGDDDKPAPGLPLAELDGYWNEAKAREA